MAPTMRCGVYMRVWTACVWTAQPLTCGPTYMIAHMIFARGCACVFVHAQCVCLYTCIWITNQNQTELNFFWSFFQAGQHLGTPADQQRLGSTKSDQKNSLTLSSLLALKTALWYTGLHQVIRKSGKENAPDEGLRTQTFYIFLNASEDRGQDIQDFPFVYFWSKTPL